MFVFAAAASVESIYWKIVTCRFPIQSSNCRLKLRLNFKKMIYFSLLASCLWESNEERRSFQLRKIFILLCILILEKTNEGCINIHIKYYLSLAGGLSLYIYISYIVYCSLIYSTYLILKSVH